MEIRQVCECYALSRAGWRPASSSRPSIRLEYARGISGGAASRDPMNIFSGSAIISLVVCIDSKHTLVLLRLARLSKGPYN